MDSASAIGLEKEAGARKVPWLALSLFSILWLDLIRLLSDTWDTREQYSYGWFVPFLAAYLFWMRWVDRPAPAPSIAGNWGRILPLCLSLLLVPLRVVFEINTDWPLLAWSYTTITVCLGLFALNSFGGGSWLRHFAFPSVFILVAVVWPHRIEKGLTQELMQVVASLTVELLGFLDIPGVQRGNLIEVSTGVVGVDEACSGIRSFQSTWMASLFLGELYRLAWLWRGGLVVLGLVVAFLLNVCRTLFLSVQASHHGLSAVDRWHDSAGLAILLASFVCLWLISLWMKRQQVSPPSAVEPVAGSPSPDGRQWVNATRLIAGIGTVAVLALVCTEAWYRSHELPTDGQFHWTARFPTNAVNFAEVEMTKRTRDLLRHDEGATGKWQEPDGTEWTGYFFRWNPKSVHAIIFARQHRPEVCLPAAGLKLVSEAGLADFEARGLKIPFRRYTYESGGSKVHVFFCQWEDGSERQIGMWGSIKSDRVRAAVVGRRKLGQQSLEFILMGHPTLDAAEAALRARLPEILQ